MKPRRRTAILGGCATLIAAMSVSAAGAPAEASATTATTATTAMAAGPATAGPEPLSTIREVTLYPGGAQIERTRTVRAGDGQVRFACLPQGINTKELRMRAGAGVMLGELQVEQVQRQTLPECVAEDAALRELTAQAHALKAELSGVQSALGFLERLADRERAGATMGDALEAVRRNGQELAARQLALTASLEELAPRIDALKARQPAPDGLVAVVQARMAATSDAVVSLTYRFDDGGWEPRYRAQLDTATGDVTLERLALIAQGTGEDWNGVPVRLSTVVPNEDVDVPGAESWRLTLITKADLLAQQAELVDLQRRSLGERNAKDMMAPEKVLPAPAVSVASFSPSVFEGALAAEYTLAQPVVLRGNGQQLTVNLGREVLPGRVHSRVQPKLSERASLVAEVDRPAGSWPVGAVQLYRDGAAVGETALPEADGDGRWTLPFGRDTRLRVVVDEERRDGATTGLSASRRERTITRRWRVENLRDQPVPVVVVEASPVSDHKDVQVRRSFSPAPTQQDVGRRPGVVAWTQTLGPRQSQRYEAVYRVESPRDGRVVNLP
ncbi:hypothetical protein CDL60_14785 [Roseateles noduli]|nr:hypothetical protein CDL60_14785 [Roseateles noduli]